MNLTEAKGGVILEVFVKPNSPRFEVRCERDEIVVHSTEEPEKGKVNLEIMKQLTKLFHKRVEIVSGFTSRKKRIYIDGLKADEAAKVLAANYID